jgi:hypothetical protein
MNYTQWTLVAQHPNLDNVTEVFSFQYKPLLPYGTISKEISISAERSSPLNSAFFTSSSSL